MNKQLIVVGALIYTIVGFALSILVLKPTKPIIEIKGEKLFSIGPLDVTNTLFTAWVVIIILVVFWLFATRRKDDVPTGIQNFGEAIIEAIDNFITGIAGRANGRRFLPLIATLFIFIITANWLALTPLFNSVGIFEELHATSEEPFHEHGVVFKDGSVALILPGAEEIEAHTEECEGLAGHDLEVCREHALEEATAGKIGEGEAAGVLLPYFRSMNTDLMTPASFAVVSVFLIEIWGITSLGFFRYMGKFINFSSPINFFVGFLELIAELARLISFSFRLFGNMLAGEILLLVMSFLMPLVTTVMLVFYGLELFVGAIQGFVFGALTLVFAVLAVTHHGDGEHAGEHAEEGAHH